MRKRIRSRVVQSETGASLVEYGLLVVAILVAGTVGVTGTVRDILGL